MEQKIFANLSPTKSLLLGLAAGVVVLCVIGFVVVSILYFTRAEASPEAPINTPTAKNLAPTAVVTPSEKPQVELFVMAYCPYGLQMQKAILPVMKLLEGKADIQIKFVDYIMHGPDEATENTRQYCIQKIYPEKYQNFLNCFVAATPEATGFIGEAPIDGCMASAGAVKDIVERCVRETTEEFAVAGVAYPVHTAENEKYGVGGSPTLVVNGATVSPVNRSPEAVKQLICSAFITPPEECATELSTTPASSGFGTAAGSGSDASCG